MACSDLVLCGTGDPEGSVTGTVGNIYLRTDGGTDSTLYVKESGSGNTGWVAKGVPASVTTALSSLDTRLDTAEVDIAALEAADIALDSRVDTLEATDVSLDSRLDAIEANDWVTTARIGDDQVTNAELANMAASTFKANNTGAPANPVDITVAQAKTLLAIAAGDVSGLATVATSGSASDLGTGTLPAGRMPALTGDVTTSAGGVATTIGNNKVTNAMLAQVNTATFKGRTTASTGNVEDLTATQATAMLNLATSTLKGLSPAFPNNTTTFLRGDGSYATPKKKAFMTFGASSRTANVSARYLNPSGSAASPAGTGIAYDVVPVTGDVVAVLYYVGTIPSTSMTLTPRISGSEAAGAVTVLNGGATVARVAISPIAVTAGTSVLVPRLDQVGTGGTDRISVCYEIEYE